MRAGAAWFRDQALARLSNAESIRILGQFGDGLDRRLMPAINRLQRLLSSPWLRNILGQSRSGVDVALLFERREIALFDLSRIGTTNARLLGSLLLLLIRQATFGRNADGRSGMHFVLIDEASWFLSKTVAELFDQARKFQVGIVLAVQRSGQLVPEDVRDAVLTNAGTMITFRVHEHEEAALLSRHLGSERLSTYDLQHLPRYEAYLQVTRDGERMEPAWMRAPEPALEPNFARQNERRLLAQARARYARPRHEVEAELNARERTMSANDEPEIREIPSRGTAFPADAA
jgi:hypothetical protein